MRAATRAAARLTPPVSPRVVRCFGARWLAALCLCAPASIARADLGEQSGEDFFRSEYRLVQGYSDEELDWHIGTTTIDVLSELTWKDLRSPFVRLEASLMLQHGLYLRGHAQRGWIRSGSNQDSDYNGPGKTLEFSRSNNSSDRGGTWDMSLALGIRGPVLRLSRESYALGVAAGVAYSVQNLVIRDGFQTLPATGSFANLRSNYDAGWASPWVGLDFVGRSAATSLTVTGSLQYHQLYYDGVGDWNLRTDFEHPDSFEHDARGSGLVARLGVQRDLGERLFVAIGLEWRNFSVDDGDDITNFADGTKVKIDLNEVNWDSFSASLSFGLRF